MTLTIGVPSPITTRKLANKSKTSMKNIQSVIVDEKNIFVNLNKVTYETTLYTSYSNVKSNIKIKVRGRDRSKLAVVHEPEHILVLLYLTSPDAECWLLPAVFLLGDNKILRQSREMEFLNVYC